MDATKHANGRDWWLLAPEWRSTKYHRWLLTPEGIKDTAVQEMNYPLIDSLNRTGWNTFSPDGSLYVDFDIHNGIRIFDFDRCTGHLGALTLLPSPDTASGPGPGVVFSPNSRFLYIIYRYAIFQYDLWADDIAASMDTVAVWDGVIDVHTLASTFYTPERGPDGKIYISSGQLRDYLHVIKYPNKKGSACGVVQRGLQFPHRFSVAMPKFPNFRLGPLDGSACDTLGLDNHPMAGFTWEVVDSLQPLLVEFTDNSFYEPAQWFWDFGGTGTSTGTNPLHAFPTDGTYTVCLTVSNQYANDTFCREVTVGTVSVKETEGRQPFALYPNPASDAVLLRLNPETGTDLRQVRIFAVSGQQVFASTLPPGSGELRISVANWPEGMYIAKTMTADGPLSRTFVVHHRR